ncbi:MAG: mechanosensitive ion channel family protein [Candidatus Caldarchaeum sp.]|uniref:Mechanosensitive ion channel family protein n=1 Tax=Caldiarchaeum subterraneum TaxID=311458 RepID=A0A7C4I7I4_CALS0|nr:mechanosensitive ion channel family protein [Candidatus Caldarchaeales archaeon]
MIPLELPELTAIVTQLAMVAIMLLVTAFAARLTSSIIRRLLFKAPPLINEQISRGASIFIWLVGLLFIVNQLGLNLDLLLLLMGLAGVAAIIAARDILSNISSRYLIGSFIPFNVGDEVQVSSFRGKVVEINPVASLLLSEEGALTVVPNSVLLKEISLNLSPYASRRITIPVHVPQGVNVPDAEAEVLKLCNKYKNKLDQRFPPLVSVKNSGQADVVLELVLLSAQPEKRNELAAELGAKISELMEKLRTSPRK